MLLYNNVVVSKRAVECRYAYKCSLKVDERIFCGQANTQYLLICRGKFACFVCKSVLTKYSLIFSVNRHLYRFDANSTALQLPAILRENVYM